MKKYTVLLLAVILFALAGCTGENTSSDKPIIAVSIVPQAAFVEAIAGDLVEVVTIITPGNSPETYVPTPQQMVSVADASIYFTIGVPAEAGNILPETNDSLYIVDLAEVVQNQYEDRLFEEAERDPHIWLSLKRVKVMAETIKDELIKLDPDNSETYTHNYNSFMGAIDILDFQVNALFSDKTVKSFIVYHPSWGYFADDYDLDMIALEEHGKEASIAHVQEVIDFAKDNNIEDVFFQAQITSSQVQSLVDSLGGEQIELNPLASNYLDNYLEVATAIAESLS